MREAAVGDLSGMMELSGLGSRLNQRPENEGLSVRFVVEPIRNEEKSKVAGRPIFDDVEICEVRVGGSPDMTRAVVEQKHRDRFPTQYEAFKRGLDQDVASGTVLSEWPILTRGQVEELRYFGIKTVEQLSAVPDSNLQKLGPGWLSIRQKARDWLKAAKDGAVVNQLREELEANKARIETLEKMLAKQTQELHTAGITPGAVPTAFAPAPDPRFAEMQAQLAALAQAVTAKSQPKKKRVAKAKPKAKAEQPETPEV